MLKVTPFLIGLGQTLVSLFEGTLNISDRLAFSEVTGSGASLSAQMDETYKTFGLDPNDTSTLEDYIREYYSMIISRLRELEADLDKDAKKKLPF